MKILSAALQTIGAISVLFIGAVGIWLFVFSPFSGPHKSTDRDKAVFVLNWAGLNVQQKWHVIASSVSPRNITGDHADYYCIQLEEFNVIEPIREEWLAGPETNPLLAEAVTSGAEWAKHEGAECFPSSERANSAQMKIMFWSVTTHGRRTTAGQVLLFEPSTMRLYYVAYKT